MQRLAVALFPLAVIGACSCHPNAPTASDRTIQVVVVTGGHDFEHDPFWALFQGYDDINCVEVRLSDDSELFEDISDWRYDAIVLYNMTQSISPRRQENFKTLLNRGVGLVVLHHAVCSFQQWDDYRRITGVRYPLAAQQIEGVDYVPAAYQHGVDVDVRVVDRRHPITRDMTDFQIHDETYKGLWFAADNHILLTTDHPMSDKTIGWTRAYGDARVCALQGGHDSQAYANPAFRRLVARAIRWSVGKLK